MYTGVKTYLKQTIHHWRIGFTLILLSQLFLAQGKLYANSITIHKNETTGLLTWTVEDEGFSIELIQLIPDFVRAVYSKHAFPQEEVDNVASHCVFGTILKNTSDTVMRFKVADWRYRTSDGKEHPVKTKAQWLEEWHKKGIKFSWTLLPSEGEWDVGDWQQGFITFKLERDAEFDLIYRWQLDGKPYEGIIQNLKCAPESIEIENVEQE